MVFKNGLFHDRVVIVTGGGTGIGRAIARSFGKLGAKVAITSRKEEHLKPTEKQFKDAGIDCIALKCDIREPDQVEKMVESVLSHYKKIDILVNNAGGQFPAPAENISPKGWSAVINNNLNGTFNVTLTVANKWFIPNRNGKVINIVANMWRGFPGLAHTGAARAGVANLTMTLAVEWAKYRIKVNAVAPGTIATEGLKAYPREVVELQRSVIPLKRFGRPDDVAQLVLFLASPAGDYITGAIIPVDGGERLWSSIWQIPDDEEAKRASEEMLKEVLEQG
jgi:citronellol/citronellal dehydrogenase